MVLVVRRVPLRSVVAHHPLALVLSGRDEGLHLGIEPPAVLPVPAVRDARLVLLEQSGEQNLRSNNISARSQRLAVASSGERRLVVPAAPPKKDKVRDVHFLQKN